jgi:hypothetical protein
MGTILLVILIVLLFLTIPVWRHSYRWEGYQLW